VFPDAPELAQGVGTVRPPAPHKAQTLKKLLGAIAHRLQTSDRTLVSSFKIFFYLSRIIFPHQKCRVSRCLSAIPRSLSGNFID
jgi:hypothetical protein